MAGTSLGDVWEMVGAEAVITEIVEEINILCRGGIFTGKWFYIIEGEEF